MTIKTLPTSPAVASHLSMPSSLPLSLPLPTPLSSSMRSTSAHRASLSPAVRLWMGQRGVLLHDHALNGLVTGRLPLRKRRGRCHIRLGSPALFFFVATAPGFEVVHARVPPSLFEDAMKALFPSTSFVGNGSSLGSVDLVMTDGASLHPPAQRY